MIGVQVYGDWVSCYILLKLLLNARKKCYFYGRHVPFVSFIKEGTVTVLYGIIGHEHTWEATGILCAYVNYQDTVFLPQ
jgi:hypothetical protein